MSETNQIEVKNNNNKIEINDNLHDSKNQLKTNENKKENFENNQEISEKNQENSDNKQNYILSKLQHTRLVVNQLDYYANSIPLGSFCFAISFILNGLHECKIHKQDDQFLYLIIFMFGGIGQITTGILEYIKSRTFPSALYLTYGLYFLSYFFAKLSGDEIFTNKNQGIFYGSWACLSFPIYIGTFKTNIFLSIQNLASIGFFVIKCIGVCSNINPLKEIVSGILELVAGFTSLYICFGQILNEHFRFQLFPSIPFIKENYIDNYKEK